jgi:hypothetical protein
MRTTRDSMGTHKVVKYRCKDCNALYASGSPAKQMHTKSTGHTDFKKETEVREDDHTTSFLYGKRI